MRGDGYNTYVRQATPWGLSDSVTALGDGILRVDTPSHGGYFVPDELLRYIPKDQQDWAARWSGSRNWYEEDCCWAAVAVAFPGLFPADAQEVAQWTLAHSDLATQRALL